ncbi:hypothetical protein, partial [Kluyvera sp. Awk 3]|uniref:hypothetical protein n=1 Tax=Kluyvera sp. Awk 3 TaxID=2963956 RepID=UPI0023026171
LIVYFNIKKYNYFYCSLLDYKTITCESSPRDNEYLACCTKKRCFALTITCAFATTFKEEEKQCFACGEFSCTQMPFLPGSLKSTYGVDRRHT